MNRTPYYLVCHETKTKVLIGYGVHSFEVRAWDYACLVDFFSAHILHSLVIEVPHEDTKGYEVYERATE